jgi:hypothetical protein
VPGGRCARCRPRPVRLADDGGVHAPREQAQGVCWDVRGPHSHYRSRKRNAGERRDRVVV